MLKQYYEKNKIEVGIDEAGRGCLFSLFASRRRLADRSESDIILKDSKKCTEKYRNKCYDYIINNCIDYSIQLVLS